MLIKCLKQGIKNQNSVLNRVGKSAIFVLNRVRVWRAFSHLPTEGYIEYPPPPTTHPRKASHKREQHPSHSNLLLNAAFVWFLMTPSDGDLAWSLKAICVLAWNFYWNEKLIPNLAQNHDYSLSQRYPTVGERTWERGWVSLHSQAKNAG